MELKNNTKRGRYAILFIWILLILHICSSIFLYQHYTLLNQYQPGDSLQSQEFFVSGLKLSIVRLLTFISAITSIIVFLKWFRRAYFNLEQMTEGLEYNNSEALWAWFIPFANLFRPFQIMKELFLKSKRILETNMHPDSGKLSLILLIIWWSLNIFNGLTIFVLLQKYGSIIELNINIMKSLILSGMSSDIIGIPNCIVTLMVLYKYTKIEPALHEIHKSKGESDYEISKHLIS